MSNVRIAFICSAGHSGSTLLDLLLGAHPSAVSLGEITHLPKNLALNTLCTCGAPARACPMWTAVLDELRADPRFHRIDNNPYVLNLGVIRASSVVDRRHQTKLRMCYSKVLYGLAYAYLRWGHSVLAPAFLPLLESSRNKLALFDAIARVLGRDLMVDSSKHYLEAAALYRAAPERVRVVLLIRDGRAVFYSGLKKGYAREAALGAWQRTYQRARPVLDRQVQPEHLIKVHYEDLTADPERELQRICTFLGIDFSAEMLGFADKERHVLNGNRMRLQPSSEIRPDVAWRRAMSPQDHRYFDERAGVLNRELGYS